MDIENVVAGFCKRTKTVGIPWAQICATFLKQNSGVAREDFELCMLRQGKKAAETMKTICLKGNENGHDYDSFSKEYGITRAFWDACVNTHASHTTRRSYSPRKGSKIYMTVFQCPIDEYPKEAINILIRFIQSLRRPLQVVEHSNPPKIEVREVR